MSPQHYLVTGATGAVGPSVVRELVGAGHAVSVLCRKEPPAGLFPDGVRVFFGDVTDVAAVESAVQGQHVVVHLASLLHMNNPSPAEELEIERVNVVGTQNIVGAAERNGVERVIFISTIAVYGYAQGGVLDEDISPQPDTIYGRTKLVAEGIALKGRNSQGEPLSSVLRLSAVYGARVKGNYRTLLGALARARFLPIGPGQNRRTLVHCDDAARAIVVASQSEMAAGRIYNVTDGSTHEMRQIISVMCQALGRSEPPIAVPVGLARGGAKVVDLAASAVGRKLSISSTIEKYLEDVVVRGDKIAEIGFKPQLDLVSGWTSTVRDLRELGQL